LERLGAAGDLATIGREAHTLRGTAGSYGLHSVASLAERLEAACAGATPDDVAGRLHALTAGMAASIARMVTQFGLD
jgi:HPt (histidine-containing phosphotransfer) domain-containing protein